MKLTAELISPTKEMAIPRTRFGNSSENSTHMTGPRDMAKLATKPRIPMRMSIGFIEMAALTNADWWLWYTSAPTAAVTACRKSTSLSKVWSSSGCSAARSMSCGSEAAASLPIV